jgi:hypothetical protein
MAEFDDLIEVLALALHGGERFGAEHFNRRDMNVAVGNHCSSVLAKNEVRNMI